MPMKTVLIGLGDIARHHAPGLRQSPQFSLAAVCDLNPDAPSREVYAHLPFYTDCREMLAEVRPDLAIIATPPATHAGLLGICEKAGVYALVEKPLAESERQLLPLLPKLKRNAFSIIYHWMFAQEVLWFLENVPLKQPQSIRIDIEDPYVGADGNILPSRIQMGGSWLDSGVNALSLLSLWVDLKQLDRMQIRHRPDEKTGLPVETDAVFAIGPTKGEIHIRWTTGRNRKQTTVRTDKGLYEIRHTEQAVYKDGQLVFADDSMNRLERHYFNFYTRYPASVIPAETTELIHRILLDHLC